MTPTRPDDVPRQAETRRDETRNSKRDASWNGDGSAHADNGKGEGGKVKPPIRDVTFVFLC